MHCKILNKMLNGKDLKNIYTFYLYNFKFDILALIEKKITF